MNKRQGTWGTVARALGDVASLTPGPLQSYWRWATGGEARWAKALLTAGLIVLIVSFIVAPIGRGAGGPRTDAEVDPPPPSRPGQPTAFIVTSLKDSGPGSLRQAILDANARPGPDVITFGSNLLTFVPTADTTIKLDSALPLIKGDLSIGVPSRAVRGGTNVTAGPGPAIRVAGGSSGFVVEGDSRVTISGLTITGDDAELISSTAGVKLDLVHIASGPAARASVADGFEPYFADVTNIGDSGPGSLREAIEFANAQPGVTRVTFSPTLTGTISLLFALPPITRDMLIVGPVSGALTLKGSPGSPVMTVGRNTVVSIAGLTLSGPRAILNEGDVFLQGTDLVPGPGVEGAPVAFSIRNAGTSSSVHVELYAALLIAVLCVALTFLLLAGSRPSTNQRRSLMALVWAKPAATLTILALAEVVIATIGLAQVGNILSHPFEINASEPVTVLYAGGIGHALFGLSIVLLFAFYSIAVLIAARSRSDGGAQVAVLGAAALAAAFVIIYPAGSRDLFHDMADARTLWVYGDNPLAWPPYVHLDLVSRAVTIYGAVASGYGPLYYVLAGPAALLGGNNLLGSLVAFKAINAALVLLLALMVGREAERLFPGRGVQAFVAVSWNPFIFYEAVANGHNDVMMVVLILAGLLAVARFQAFAAIAFLMAAVLVKYAALPLIPLALWWWWRNGRKATVARASVFLAALIAGCLAFELSIGGWKVEVLESIVLKGEAWRSFSWFVDWYLQRSFDVHIAHSVRIASLAALGVCVAIVLSRLRRDVSSLYEAAFFIMAAVVAFAIARSLPWYSLWFIPLGFLLPGTRFAAAALMASAATLISYAIFPWWPASFYSQISWLITVWLLPAAYLARQPARPTELMEALAPHEASVMNSS